MYGFSVAQSNRILKVLVRDMTVMIKKRIDNKMYKLIGSIIIGDGSTFSFPAANLNIIKL